MPDTKISAAVDAGALMTTDMLPLARSGSTTAYHATMAEIATYANGAYTPNYATSPPIMNGTAAAGTAAFVSRGDHVHPSDISRLPLSGGTMTGLLTLSGVPTVSLHAATKGYVDTATGSSTAAIPGESYADNGGFAINQRGYVSGTALAAGIYGHDRWKAGAGGCTYTFTQSGNPATTITITAGSLQQVVEGAAIIGGTYMLSWTGTAQGRVGAGSYAASPVTVSGITASANTTIEFNTGTLGRVKFEAGSTATPWVAASPQQDLARCQRLYQRGNAYINAYNGAGSSIGYAVMFPVPMRAAATVTLSNFGYANASAAGVLAPTAYNFAFSATVTAAGNAVAAADFAASADL